MVDVAARALLSFSTTLAMGSTVAGRDIPVMGGRFYRFEAFRRPNASPHRGGAPLSGCSGRRKGKKVTRHAGAESSSRYVASILIGSAAVRPCKHDRPPTRRVAAAPE